ncbi:hypothetical protein [Mitsuaria sp. GD03876]|uniref:hypothetical protein n=1 Tax=Mitsuaria sp. GD03876 TaxID=2975399 RepID=UPI00244A90E7|nr:hypothetical protein [Mitsuaria sp. GD03876]MDH0865626.1 hypothetical protein [Mitsuaria sp. GD03876]
MNAERAFVSMLLVATVVGLAFLGLAVGQAIKLGEITAVLRHPLLGSGTAYLVTAALGGLLLLTLRPQR